MTNQPTSHSEEGTTIPSSAVSEIDMQDDERVALIIMDRNQAESQMHELERALSSPGKTILLMASASREIERKMRAVRSNPQASAADLPAPTDIIVGTTYIVALPLPFEDFCGFVADYMSQAQEEENTDQ